jgi:hypothetical protein
MSALCGLDTSTVRESSNPRYSGSPAPFAVPSTRQRDTNGRYLRDVASGDSTITGVRMDRLGEAHAAQVPLLRLISLLHLGGAEPPRREDSTADSGEHIR